MADNIVQKLIFEMVYRVDDRGQKKHDKFSSDSRRNHEAGEKKTSEKVTAIKDKEAEKQKRIAQRVGEEELKIRVNLARRTEQLAQSARKKAEADYNQVWKQAEREAQAKEKALRYDQSVRRSMERQKQQEADRAVKQAEINAKRESKIKADALRDQQRMQADFDRRRLQSRERDFDRRLQDIQNRNNAESQARRDSLSQGHFMQQSGRSIKSIGSSGMNLFGGLIGESTHTAGDIEALLNQVQAHGGFVSNDRKMLSSLAKSISVSSGFQQTEILKGMKELGKAGFEGQELKDITATIPDFSLAIDTDFERASKLATDMMFLFGYQTKDLVKMQDVLTSGLAASKLDYADMSTSLKFSAGAWKMAGGTLPDLMATLALNAQNGIKGSTAGTGNRTAAINMAVMEASAGQEDLQKDGTLRRKRKATTVSLGLTKAFDGDNFKYLDAMMQFAEIAKKKKMTKPQITSAMNDLFGKPGTVANSAVFDSFYDDKKRANSIKLVKKIGNSYGSGKTAEVAGIQKQGYNFQEGQFTNSMNNVKEAIGGNFLPTFTEALEKLSAFFNMISENYPTLSLLAAATITVGFAVSALAVALGSLLIFAGAVTVAMGVLEVTFMGLITTFFLIPLAIMAAVAAVIYLGYQFYQLVTGGKNIFSDFANWVNDIFSRLFLYSIPDLFDNLVAGFNDPINTIKGLWLGFLDWFSSTGASISNVISGIFGRASTAASVSINSATAPLAGVTKNLQSSFNVTNHITANGTKASPQGIAQSVTGSMTGMNKLFSGMAKGY